MARTWPGLAGALGGEFREWFTGYARTDPLPPAGGPLADGRAFARALARAGRLPDEGRVEALAVDLRYKRCRAGSSGLAPRSRGSFVLRTAVLARPRRRLILAARLPLLGERWLTLPL